MKMNISLGSSILVLGIAASIFAEDRGVVQRQVSQGADSLNLTYSLIVNGHEFIANLVNTDMYVTVDGFEFDVLTGIDQTGRFTWEASNKSNHGLAFKGFLDSDRGLTLLTLESTGDDSLFVESKTITLIVDDHLAELFGVDVGTLLTDVYTVRT